MKAIQPMNNKSNRAMIKTSILTIKLSSTIIKNLMRICMRNSNRKFPLIRKLRMGMTRNTSMVKWRKKLSCESKSKLKKRKTQRERKVSYLRRTC